MKRDELTRKATAFPSWGALLTAVHVNGYIPTLRRNHPGQRTVGALLESEGVRVFWIGKEATHAA